MIDRLHPSYDRARQVWNGLIDRYPAVMARCTGTADVVDPDRRRVRAQAGVTWESSTGRPSCSGW